MRPCTGGNRSPIGRTTARRVSAVAAAACLLSTAVASAQTATGGTVSGSIKLPDPAARGEPPQRNQGFLARVRNPILAPVPFDPLPWIIVVLEPQGALSAEAKQPPKLPPRYELIGEAFARPIFGVMVNSEVEIKNSGRNSHRLVAPAIPELLEGDPVNPGGVRTATLSVAHHSIEIRDPDSAHVSGHLVAFPLRYFAVVDGGGNFEIADVPGGRWTVRLWYRDGWLKMKQETIDVDAKRTSSVKLALPPALETEVPATAGKPQ